MQSLEYCVVVKPTKDMPQIFNSLLQVQKRSRNNLKDAPPALMYLSSFISRSKSNRTLHFNLLEELA